MTLEEKIAHLQETVMTEARSEGNAIIDNHKKALESLFEKHKKEVAERARVYAIVKKMNKDNKKKQKKHQTKESNKTKRKPVRFPGI